MNRINTGMLYSRLIAKRTKDSFKSWLHSEKGSGEIIAMVLVIGVVIVLGVMFSGKIKEFFESIWNSLVEGGGAEGIKN